MSVAQRIAMVGAGYFAQFQLEGWRDAGTSVSALCDLDPTKAMALAERFHIGACFDDLTQMLDQVQPELLDVVLPPAAQAPVVLAVLARGIPTICQKPFGTDLAQAEAMTEAAERAGVPLVVHENFRFTPWFQECRRLIDAGHFGRLHSISFRLRPGDGQGPAAYPDRQPCFQTMPQLLAQGAVGKRIVEFARVLFGWLPGGLGVVTVMSCTMFGGIWTGLFTPSVSAAIAVLYGLAMSLFHYKDLG